jgi:hypothetical protein
MRLENHALAVDAENGRLVTLPWKGGCAKKLRKPKYGTLLYLAMWQGLRGEDLNIDSAVDVTLTCIATEMTVVFNAAAKKTLGRVIHSAICSS